jgi:hypothetical protein
MCTCWCMCVIESTMHGIKNIKFLDVMHMWSTLLKMIDHPKVDYTGNWIKREIWNTFSIIVVLTPLWFQYLTN